MRRRNFDAGWGKFVIFGVRKFMRIELYMYGKQVLAPIVCVCVWRRDQATESKWVLHKSRQTRVDSMVVAAAAAAAVMLVCDSTEIKIGIYP